MLMMKQVLWGLTWEQQQLAFVSRLWRNPNVFIFKRLLAVCKVNGSQGNDALSEQTLRFFNKQAQVFTAYKGYSRGSEEETVHKHYTAELEKERDTVELCMACPCTHRASSNIDAFPSAIVLPKQKPEDHSLEKTAG